MSFQHFYCKIIHIEKPDPVFLFWLTVGLFSKVWIICIKNVESAATAYVLHSDDWFPLPPKFNLLYFKIRIGKGDLLSPGPHILLKNALFGLMIINWESYLGSIYICKFDFIDVENGNPTDTYKVMCLTMVCHNGPTSITFICK